MLPFASGVNRFFRFREISFRLRFREPFSLVAKGKFALNHANCQATSATIFKTIALFTRKPAQAADFLSTAPLPAWPRCAGFSRPRHSSA